jgi:AcrR family transcriptional regulator
MNERSFIFKESYGSEVKMSEPVSSKGDQAHAKILEAAQKLFISKGYNATSMRDIAESAGYRAVAGIYNHFESKEAIFRALIEERNPYDELVSALEANHGDTAAEFIRNGLSQVMPLMAKHVDFIDLVQIDLREFGGENVKRVVGTLIMPRVFQIVPRVLALPGLKPVEPLVFIRLIASTVIGYIITEGLAASILRGNRSQDEWVLHYTELVLHGLVEPDNGA